MAPSLGTGGCPCTCASLPQCQPHSTQHCQHVADGAGSAPYSHWMYHALQIALLRRIFSRQSSRSPLKFFHFGDTSFPLKHQAKERLRGGHYSRALLVWGLPRKPSLEMPGDHQPGGKSGAGMAVWLCCRLLAWHPREHPREHPQLLFALRTAQA